MHTCGARQRAVEDAVAVGLQGPLGRLHPLARRGIASLVLTMASDSENRKSSISMIEEDSLILAIRYYSVCAQLHPSDETRRDAHRESDTPGDFAAN